MISARRPLRVRDDEADRRVFTAYNAFPLTSDGIILARAYRNKLMERYLNSYTFRRVAAKYVNWYAQEAIGLCQDVVDGDKPGEEVVFAVKK